eukprot:1685399-Pyramimonas_sp.AAC.1
MFMSPQRCMSVAKCANKYSMECCEENENLHHAQTDSNPLNPLPQIDCPVVIFMSVKAMIVQTGVVYDGNVIIVELQAIAKPIE